MEVGDIIGAVAGNEIGSLADFFRNISVSYTHLRAHETVGDEIVDGNMVVPIDLLAPIIDDLLTMGRPNKKARPWLGLFGAESEGAVVVAALTEGGPAHDADVEVGDIVRAVAGNEIGSLADFFRNIWSIGPAGVEVPLLIERD